ncbi:major facilitator superfamily domain-containing protein [Microdochium trichocladiopsis]|uniref:Major facilitator superfamily domain-containing protein n=1 Tax=Microdochium trichocladiopsis TaxID=1682393 RepID=A0A9P8Y747_9PEZI|nr:major facilitator superfamily domain-containing protein [Microdochium trichocladiopsis]KAH7031182.1 major facilitator superfamily domain-containing protein [Microdochium trichocladiopsis]
MGLGVLEDTVLDHVPGTTRYFDDPDRPQTADTADARGLKCDHSGPIPIILIPQPSDDPNDPLNWPLWRRDLITFILSLTAIFATCLGPILAANTLTLSIYFSLNFTYIALLTGYFLLGVGVAGFFCVPSGRIWGKRHLFILGTCILIATSAWAGAVGKNYTSFVWARIFQGIGCAPFESLVNAAIGDLYFVHERGKRMAFTNLAVFGGAFFTPILVGKITHTIRWWWTFNLVAIFSSVCLIAIFLWVPETAYVRDAALNTDIFQESPDSEPSKELARPSPTEQGQATIPAPKSFVQRLALFDGRKTNEFFPVLLFRPLPLFVQPAFLWACLIQGTMIGWTVFIGVILAALFLGPPLFWTEVPTGYAYTGPFVGAVLGFLISGALSDWSARYMTKLNGGVYEPEFRIVLIIPQLIFGCMGLFGFGYTADMTLQSQIHWVVPIVFFGFEVCGMIIGATASALYLVDAYRHQAIEGFTMLLIFKNLFSFGLTFKAYDWLVQGGVVYVFKVLGLVQIVICLTSIPMYIYGKRLRSFFHRHDLLKMTGLA